MDGFAVQPEQPMKIIRISVMNGYDMSHHNYDEMTTIIAP